MPNTDDVRALVNEAQANGIREGNLRGVVAALCQATLTLADEVDRLSSGGVFVPDDFPLAEPTAGAE
jgi:hypothetical protein